MEPCELCLVKQQLKMYEGVIIDSVTEQNVKLSDTDTQRAVYSWKTPYQEAILKSKGINYSLKFICLDLNYICVCALQVYVFFPHFV